MYFQQRFEFGYKRTSVFIQNSFLMTRKMFVAIAAFLISVCANAQFYTDGGDPGALRWYSIDSPHYRIIYPEGLDSLARVYGSLLETFRMPVSLSSGLVPGSAYRSRTPVVLHAYSTVSNGSVTWTPKRMQLYTTPQPYRPEAMPWETSLAVHESRHLSQMQAGYRKVFRPFTWLLGEMVPGAVAGVYPGLMFLEGDAVVAETALTAAGRGRSAEFMNYYMSAFDEGDYRSFYRWQNGSWRHYSPNHYAAGYMAIAGKRVFFNDPLFTQRYFDKIAARPLRLNHFRREYKRGTGMGFNAVFDSVMVSFHNIWAQEALERMPFTEAQPLKDAPRWFEEYAGAVPVGDDLYVISSGLVRAAELKKISPDGTETVVRPFSSSTGRLSTGGGALWWSESIKDPRWSLDQSSRIRRMDLESGKISDLTKEGRYFNPVPSPDATSIAAVHYPVKGGTAVVVLDAGSGEETARIAAPDSLAVYEVVWVGGSLAVSGISPRGSGLYIASESGFRTLLEPQPVSLHSLSEHDGRVIFTSDRTGVNEIYSIDTGGELLLQLTSTRYGSADAVFKGDTLYFTSLTREGRLLYRTPSDRLLYRPVEFSDIHSYPVADALSAQEKALAGGEPVPDAGPVAFSEPVRYRKALHIPNFHSWVPFYIGYNGDGIDDVSALGVTGLFQNHLGTASGLLSYGNIMDQDGGGRRNMVRLQFSYTGLYPEIEINAIVGDRRAYQYMRRATVYRGTTLYNQVTYDFRDAAHASADVKVSVPLSQSIGGISRGITPSLRYYISNDMYDRSDVRSNLYPMLGEDGWFLRTFGGKTTDRNVPMQLLTASVRGYIMRPMASSREYPGLGASAEIGYQGRLGLTDIYTAGIYANAVGYLPGIAPSHGLRLSALFQHRLSGDCLFGENVVNTYPRGFANTDIMSYFAAYSDTQIRLTADYALPVYLGDIRWLSPLAYITHFMVKPFGDMTLFTDATTGDPGRLGNMVWTAGAEITARMSNFLWIPFDTTIGVRIGYNGSPSYGLSYALEDGMLWKERLGGTYLGFLFSIDI